MNENVRGAPAAYTNQPIVLPGRRPETQVPEEYPRATPNSGYGVAQSTGGYPVSQQIDQNRYSDPVRRYSHSHRPSGYLIPRSQSLRAAELPINDMQNTPVKPQEADIVYYGYPDSDPEGNLPSNNAQFAKPPTGQFNERDEKTQQLLSPNQKEARYVIKEDFVKNEDTVSESKIFKLRELIRMQQKLMLVLFAIMVLIIVALIIVVAILMLKDS